MSPFLRDLRYALRMLRTRPLFAVAAILSLALGIGACTAIFSVVDAVLLRSLDYPQADRLLSLREVSAEGVPMRFAEPNIADVRSSVRSLSSVAQYTSYVASVLGGREPVRVQMAIVSGEFFAALNVPAVVGRSFSEGDLNRESRNVAVVSYGFWQKLLGGETDLSLRQLRVENESYTVIGVMPATFNFPTATEVWIPRSARPMGTSRTAHNWRAVARLRDGVTLSQAGAELTALARQLKAINGARMDAVDFSAVPVQEAMVKDVRRTLYIGSAAVLLLLLIACANVTNLLLAQAMNRQKEIVVKLALGAGRWRMIQQFIAECFLLTLIASVLGMVLSFWGVDLLVSLNRDALPRAAEISVDWRALVFTVALSVIVAVGLGAIIAWRTGADVDLQASLKEAGRSLSPGRRTGLLRNALVVAQIALTLVLLVAAGLLIRSFTRLLSIDPGFRTEGTVTMNLDLPSPKVENDAQRLPAYQKVTLFHQQLLERLREIPGVISAGGADALPMTNDGSDGSLVLDNNPQKMGYANYRLATRDYFATMGLQLRRGRLFDESDKPGNIQVALANESAAREIWKGEDPLGRQINWSNMDGDEAPIQIVGIISDVRENGLEEKVLPTIYINALQRPWRTTYFSYVVHSALSPETLIPAMRREVKRLDPNLPMEFSTLGKIFSSTLDQRRFSMAIFAVFASVALLLALTGIYAMMSYAVSQRVNEIGIRMALGAGRADILNMMMRHGLKLIIPGVAIGVSGAVVVSRLLTSLLYEVSATDPLTFTAVAVLLMVVALLACFLPARRATRVDPMVALRYE